MVVRYFTDVWEIVTEEQIWGNFDSDLYLCDDRQLIMRLIELGGESLLKDYLHVKDALLYPWGNYLDLGGYRKEYLLDYLREMLKRQTIHPKQKEVGEMALDTLETMIQMDNEW